MSPASKNSPFWSEKDRIAGKKPFLRLRAHMVQAIRQFFVEKGYLEVETPQIIPSPIPEIHIDAIRAGAGYLHPSPEFCMKRLLAAGFTEIFQITKCFRSHERGAFHLSEFSLLEWYKAGFDYHALMDECRQLLIWISDVLGMGGCICYEGQTINFKLPWLKITVNEAFSRYSSVSLESAMKHKFFDEIMVRDIEPALQLEGPVFLYDYPAELASLARLKQDDPEVAERFEIYIGGLEVANGFSELTDAKEQRVRFEKEREQRAALGKEPYPMPDKFLRSLEYMPSAAGVAVGVDRLAMLFSGRSAIDDVVTFTPEEL